MTVVDQAAPSAEEEEEFQELLAVAHEREEERDRAMRLEDGSVAKWVPQRGSQEDFLVCPLPEIFLHGTRGGGKTLALLMKFAQHVGKGYGADWRGVIFRETYPQLADIVAKSIRWFMQIFPGAKFVSSGASGMAWHFPDGEVLMFRHMRRPDDYWNFHGHELPFIGWEELTNWANDLCYKAMFSCCRSSNPDVPRIICSTSNPYGVGHGWVKARFRLHGKWWTSIVTTDSIDVDGNVEPPRVAIYSSIKENKILLKSDPGYMQKISASAENSAMADAWKRGSWKFALGGMFSDVWVDEFNNVPAFHIPPTWRIDRSFDWGSSKPFSVGWWAESDGCDLRFPDGSVRSTVRGDLFRICEWYGWTGRADEGLRMLATDVAKGIVERELLRGWRVMGVRKSRVRPGPADSSIYTVEDGHSIAESMEKPIRIDGHVFPGVKWVRADKSPGSRQVGWEQMRAMMRAAHPQKGGPRESPGLFVVGEECPQFLRTVLSLPRDKRKPDDVDTKSEDHIGDEARYRVRVKRASVGSGKTVGMG